MDRYTPYDRARGPKVRPGSGLLRVADGIMLAVTLPAAVAALLGYVSPHVDPHRTLLFAFAGLAAPVTLLMNLVTALYWIMRWRRWAFVPLGTLIIGMGGIFATFRPTLLKVYEPAERDRNAITVVSHNVHGFLEPQRGQPCSDRTTAMLAGLKPDILCIQEYQTTPSMPKAEVDAGLGALPNHRVFYKLEGMGGGFGLAIYSKLPVVRSQPINFDSSTSCFMWADILWRRDTLRVYNCHFQTTSIDAADKRFVTAFELSDSLDTGRKVHSILSKLGRNFRIRAVEADTLSRLIHSSPYDVVVCGDFNDTPLSYSYHTIRGRLRDSFVDKGSGSSNTFNGLYNIFRIDYVLHSRSLRTVYYANPPTDLSDHNPVTVTLRRQ